MHVTVAASWAEQARRNSASAEWLCLAAFGCFLALAGAYGTGDAEPWRRFAYWVPLLLIGGLILKGLEEPVEKRMWRSSATPAVILGSTAIFVSVPIALFAWLLSGMVFRHSLALDDLADAYQGALTIAAVSVALLLVLRGRQPRPRQSDASAQQALLGRLGAHYRSAEIWAVRAEDHYVRFYTSHGEALVLMRFTDVVASLRQADGFRVHRSWWVARPAVGSAQWKRGRGELKLTAGLTVPVSRLHSAALKRVEWGKH